MSMFTSFDVSASGMTAQRYRMDVIAENVANANTTRTEDGSPYVRKVVNFQAINVNGSSHTADFASHLGHASQKYNGTGVKITGTFEDNKTPMVKAYDPSHPDADENGYVTYPNVSIVTEMTNMIDASRSYEANATAFSASKNMASQGLNIGKNS